MSYSLYDATIPMARRSLKSLTEVLKTGEAAPNAASLLAARIHPDMRPLSFQVQTVAGLSTRLAALLQGLEYQPSEGEVTTFADCYALIAKAEEKLAAADRDLINQLQNDMVNLDTGSTGSFQITGTQFADGYILPNLFFHLCAAYNILRKEDVPLGKMIYLQSYVASYLSGSSKA
ncbi:hypothetical protein Trco_004985 [Trichoderma cornu-damae]|uniref:Helix-turn-helix-domain containing protein type n=1 Tax=Trichoderma cornu-damae TaxID=654480 RepID=A0A9P8QNX2_9HYPO|nr:hypothetical protein Trco_004985 [Trichoderma cornu-damae]